MSIDRCSVDCHVFFLLVVKMTMNHSSRLYSGGSGIGGICGQNLTGIWQIKFSSTNDSCHRCYY